MKRSIVMLAAFVCACFSLTANAVDMFTFEGKQKSVNQSVGNNAGEPSTSFTATLNSTAMNFEDVVFNLPHKQIRATRMDNVGDSADQLTPYSFKSQKGFVLINSKNDTLDNVLIFDEAAQDVFRGKPQADGSITFTQADSSTFICTNFEKHDLAPSNSLHAAEISHYQSLNDLTFAQVTSLESRPGASSVIYIDYLAGSVSGTAWNIDGGPATINYENYSYDADASTFSLIDLQSMYAGWAEAAEDYAPFDVNITTDLSVYNAVQHRNKSKIIATSTNWRNTGGVAFTGVFGLRNDDFFNIGWAFNRTFGSLGITNSHESGHHMGLSHDRTTTLEYYPGAGNYGTVMGEPFNKDFVHWNNGSYPNADQDQDDLGIIKGVLGELPDDHGNTNDTATPLGAQELLGIISPAGLSLDVDVFSISLASAGGVDLRVRSLFQQPNNSGGDNTAGGLNLSARIELRDAANNLIQQKLPSSNAANNDFNYSGNLSAGTYYLSIEPEAYMGANFNAYGNGGYYKIFSDFNAPPAPDLLVELAEVSDSTLEAGQSFQLSVSLKNQGVVSSNATILTYYRSTDSIISSSDLNVGTDNIAALAADAFGSKSISLSAPSTSVAYYYGACLSNATYETNIVNNCSPGVLVNIAPVIDLIVESPEVGDTILDPGQLFFFSSLLKNQGNTPSSGTGVTYFLSDDTTISNSDVDVKTGFIAAIPGNTSLAERDFLRATSSPGTHYYGVCIDPVIGESDTSNNCSSAVSVTVAATVDLTVESPSISDTTLSPEQSFTFSATLGNLGNSSSAAITLTYYRSTNATIDSSDTSIASSVLGSLSANASIDQSIMVTAPTIDGEYYYGACLTVLGGEINSDNNCSAGLLVTVSSQPIFDLTVESPEVDTPSPATGQPFTLSVSVKNDGNTASAPTTLTYFRSTDEVITVSDTNIGALSVASIEADTSSVYGIAQTAPSSPGGYYYGACVTAVSGETVSDNNCSIYLYVRVPKFVGPDDYEPNNNNTTAKPISIGETQNHSIHELDDLDWLEFTLSEPMENIVIETGGSAFVDTRVWLYDAALNQLDFNDDGGVYFYSKIALDMPLAEGRYYILVDALNNFALVENYTISIRSVSDDAICVPIKVANGNMAMICL